jgi:predicted RNA-binding protein with PUA-like domain
MAFWLVKTEPSTFSYQDLLRDGRTGWDGVRNFQARNYLRAMRQGDRVVIYHSNANPPGVAGLARIVCEHEPDPTQFDAASAYFDPRSTLKNPRWSWVFLEAEQETHFISLAKLKSMPALGDCPLIARGSRLSVIPLTGPEFDALVAAGV